MHLRLVRVWVSLRSLCLLKESRSLTPPPLSHRYFLDLCWAQAFGLVIGPLQAELGVAENHVGDLSAAFSAGLCVGAFSWGLLCDIIGRKWCFNLTCLIASVFGLIFAGPSNYNGLCFITACIGVGVGGNMCALFCFNI